MLDLYSIESHRRGNGECLYSHIYGLLMSPEFERIPHEWPERSIPTSSKLQESECILALVPEPTG